MNPHLNRRQGYLMGKREPLQKILFRKLGSSMQKNQTGIPSYILYKNKEIKNLKVRLKTIKILEENIGNTL